MTALPKELRDLIATGPLAHLATINADGSPQVSVIWLGQDGDDLVSGHLAWYTKLRNIERDPRVVLSFDAPRTPGVVMAEHAILKATAAIEPSDQTWDLLNRLCKVYVAPDAEFSGAEEARPHRPLPHRPSRRCRPVGRRLRRSG
ncbi:PPOX class F420-dependent oxidoreductase [Actinoplanes sp. ATCC 53533]|uniref:PPOX class F420-dependent oxidoreductase n=1 Tax=Actinoplanes sp. ATCC 53533 TaxID=1288362 RepID=UPI001F1924F0|nr:PPOX class F420-dependent oxidoreductase [Actinoplanes sp. ATCC 53533]